jgi:eukaryotic-like serine/threonine-protein kinase
MNADADEPGDRTPCDDHDTEKTVRERPLRTRSAATTRLRLDTAALSTIPVPADHSRSWRSGSRVDRYELIQQLGAGGMSVVWSARDVDLGREVAVKLSSPELHVWLLGEARAMARLSHPNVVGVYDVGETEDGLFIAMERIDGGTLGEWLRATPRAWTDILSIFIAAGRGLAEAHRVGLIHRDFKPDNVLVGADGVARVSDFGLAIPVGQTAQPPTGRQRALTEEGALVGTPAYMSPEQLLGQQVTERSDQFSFCLALFEALHETMPFGAPSGEPPAAFLLAATVEDRLPQSDSELPEPLQSALLRGLACDPDERWPSMEALVAALERCLPGRPQSATPSGPKRM